jgi:hypothetical protein
MHVSPVFLCQILLLILPSAHQQVSFPSFFTLIFDHCVSDGVTELNSLMSVAAVECGWSHTCHHLFTVTADSVTRHFSVNARIPEFTDSHLHNKTCSLFTKNSTLQEILVNNFKELSLCPVENELNVQSLQLLPQVDTIGVCAFHCIISSVCEFFRFNNSCYHGVLSTFMVSRSAGIEGCRVWKRIRHWDDKFEAFYSFNHSISNLANATKYNMTRVGNPSFSRDGLHVSDGNYVKTFVTSPSLLTNYFT